ncbi:MAG: adenylate/guanylate cyclase domain-containing protein [Fimbriimonadaceae bacterium]
MNDFRLASNQDPIVDGYQEIHALTERLRMLHGELGDEAIVAISEATGAPESYVRLIAASSTGNRKRTMLEQIRGSYRSLTPEVRAMTLASLFGLASGFFTAVSTAAASVSSIGGTVALVALLLGLGNAAASKNLRTAALAGGLFGGVAMISGSAFGFLFGLVPGAVGMRPHPVLLLAFLAAGAVAGVLLNRLVEINRKWFGLKDPVQQRAALIQQLHEIQDRLRSDERDVTFVSVDIVGSTKIKTTNDQINVEYTFGEYHSFVETVARRFGGQLHSTAGDGVTLVFEQPESGYRAGRALLAGLFEFNAFRNRLDDRISIRCGCHTGSVHAAGDNLSRVNFAHVIDVAAHMQKCAEPGSMMVSEATAAFVPGGMKSIGTEEATVEGLRAVICRPAQHHELPIEAAATPEG